MRKRINDKTYIWVMASGMLVLCGVAYATWALSKPTATNDEILELVNQLAIRQGYLVVEVPQRVIPKHYDLMELPRQRERTLIPQQGTPPDGQWISDSNGVWFYGNTVAQ